MKKKFLMILFAICFIVPCGSFLTACDGNKNITTISASEWVTALKFQESENFQLTHKYGEDYVVSIVRDGDIVYQENNAQPVNEYQSKESDKYYAYNNDSGFWVKTEISEDEFNFTLSALDMSLLDYSEFTYNSNEKAYEADTMFVFTDAKLYFENGKIVKITAKDGNISVLYTIAYENEQLVLPVIQQ